MFDDRLSDEAFRAKRTLGYFLHFALVQSVELSDGCEANARLAALGERSYASAKIMFLL